MTVELPPESDWKVCPKRIWILHSFSDDEWLGEDGALPRGLQFHLSRCETCRELADRLRSVSDTLGAMNSLEPPEAVVDRANQQLHTALGSGARSTGRVAVPDEPIERTTWTWRNGFFPLAHVATAAAVVVAVCLWWARADDSPAGARMEQTAAMGHTLHPTESPADSARGSNSDPASADADPRIAGASRTEAPEKPLHPRAGRPDGDLEATFSDRADRIPPASVLTTRGRRSPAWRPPTVDTPSYTVSTSTDPESR